MCVRTLLELAYPVSPSKSLLHLTELVQSCFSGDFAERNPQISGIASKVRHVAVASEFAWKRRLIPGLRACNAKVKTHSYQAADSIRHVVDQHVSIDPGI